MEIKKNSGPLNTRKRHPSPQCVVSVFHTMQTAFEAFCGLYTWYNHLIKNRHLLRSFDFINKKPIKISVTFQYKLLNTSFNKNSFNLS